VTLLLALKTPQLPVPPTALITIDQLTRHVLAFGKFFRRLQQPAIPKFVALPGCSDLVLYCWRQVIQANGGAPSQISGQCPPGTVFLDPYLLSMQMGLMLFIPLEHFFKAWFSSKIVWDSGHQSNKQTSIEEIVRSDGAQINIE
jgi:hypothetical protein